MTYTPMIIDAVYRHLANDSELRGIVGGRIFYGGFENQQIPCVTFIIVSAPNNPSFEVDEIDDGEIQVDCYTSRGGGVAGAMATAERIDFLLNRATIPAAGFTLTTQKQGDPIPEFEEDAWRSMQQFDFFAN